MLLRSTLSQKWVNALKIATNSYNKTPIERLGWLKVSISRRFSDVLNTCASFYKI